MSSNISRETSTAKAILKQYIATTSIYAQSIDNHSNYYKRSFRPRLRVLAANYTQHLKVVLEYAEGHNEFLLNDEAH